MDWTDAWRDAFRTELRAEAIGFACHGWPVVPGTYPQGATWIGHEHAPQWGSVPIHDDWQDRAGLDPENVAALWSGSPYSVLLVTGLGLDALDLPAELGRSLAAGLRSTGLVVPIAATPEGRWLFPIASGGELNGDLRRHSDVALHGVGSWIPLPPSVCSPGVVHWRVKPSVTGWQVPRMDELDSALLAAVAGSRHVATARG